MVKRHGKWTQQVLTSMATEYLEFVLNAPSGVLAELAVYKDDEEVQFRRPNLNNKAWIVLPLVKTGHGSYAIQARTTERSTTFPIDTTITLTIKVGGTDSSYRFTDIPLGGFTRATLVDVRILPDGVLVSPGSLPKVTGIAGAVAGRQEETGGPTKLSVTSFYEDTSASMAQISDGVQGLRTFIDSYCEAIGVQMPPWHKLTALEEASADVREVGVVPNPIGARAVLVTDLVPVVRNTDCLVIGSEEVFNYFGGGVEPDMFFLESSVLALVARDIQEPRKLDSLRPLIEWLSATIDSRKG